MAQQQQQETEQHRTELDRYPGVLTDWGGRFLDKRILNLIQVGNIVRVSFRHKSDKQFSNTAYMRIIRKCKKHKNWFVGVCEDPYYGEDPYFLLKNGNERAFSVHHITEIPLTWNGNQNLEKNAKFYNKARTVTGAM